MNTPFPSLRLLICSLICATSQAQIPINIDGVFADWTGRSGLQAAQAGNQSSSLQWTGLKLADDEEYLYVYASTAQTNLPLNQLFVFLNTDRQSTTGYQKQIGAEFMWHGGALYQYSGIGANWMWTVKWVLTNNYAITGNQIELKIPRSMVLPNMEKSISVSLYSGPAGCVSKDMNGSFEDWTGSNAEEQLGPDTTNGQNQVASGRDIDMVWAAQDYQYFYARFLFKGPTDPQNNRHYLFVDVDQSINTGYITSFSQLGADFMVADGLYRYKGNGLDWNWEAISGATIAWGKADSNQIELKVESRQLQWSVIHTPLHLFYVTESATMPAGTQDYFPEPGKYAAFPKTSFIGQSFPTNSAAGFSYQLTHQSSAFPLPPSLKISEIMYNPIGGSQYEFIEIANTGHKPIPLDGMYFNGIDFTFPSSVILMPGTYGVVASSVGPFTNRYPGIVLLGYFSGRLANEGERVALYDKDGAIIDAVSYENSGNWPEAADGDGYSLERIDFVGDSSDPVRWKASGKSMGTPGLAPPVLMISPVRINEIRVDGDVDDDDHDEGDSDDHPDNSASDWVELFNSSSQDVDLTGWSLSDKRDKPRTLVIPADTKVKSHGYITFVTVKAKPDQVSSEENDGFGLSQEGESLFLFDAQGKEVGALSYGPQTQGLSMGLINNQWILCTPTPTQTNQMTTVASVTNLVINEWLADSLPGVDDWLELYNRNTNLPVALDGLWLTFNNQLMQINYPVFIAPNGFLRLWADEQAGPNHLPFKLSALGGTLQLTDSQRSIIDKVTFGPQSEGLTFGRVPDGASTIVSISAEGSPGKSNILDLDNDGIPDFWEHRFGFNLASNDANLDPDKDGATNYDEYKAGTDPLSSSSNLKLQISRTGKNAYRLLFSAIAQQTYSLLYRTNLTRGNWQKLTDITQIISERVEIQDQLASTEPVRIYAIATPIQNLPGEPAVQMASPVNQATNVPSNIAIHLRFHDAVDPSLITTNTFRVLQDNQIVDGRYSFSDSFRAVTFNPRYPLLHSTRISLTLTNLPNNILGTKPIQYSWSFTTMPSPDFTEDRSVYQDNPQELNVANVKIFETPDYATFAEIIKDLDGNDEYEAEVPVLFQAEGFGASDTEPNATLSLRGASSRYARQKSFQIKLFSKNDLWRDQRRINLNKHRYDLSRVRNKLSFDLFREIPHLGSLRTAFAKLHINSTNYGLFTQVENPDNDMLARHGLDPNGHLYKANYFEFFRYSDALRETTDPKYDIKEFEKHLQIRGNTEHGKLLAMLDAVNDSSKDINRVIEQHFNRNNFLTWFAVNILIRNIDTSSQNYLLYSPTDSSAWYFIPWDCDGTWDFHNQPYLTVQNLLPRWRKGIFNWWNVVLQRRFLQDPKNLSDLNAKIEELQSSGLLSKQVPQLISTYQNLVKNNIEIAPDFNDLPVVNRTNRMSEWETELIRIPNTHLTATSNHFASLENPAPVFLGGPYHSPEGRTFTWSDSFDLQGDGISYDFYLSKKPTFETGDIVYSKQGITTTQLLLRDSLVSGNYFWRVIIRDSKNPDNHWQIPFTIYTNPSTLEMFFGVSTFSVP